jgi:hypothetical protein
LFVTDTDVASYIVVDGDDPTDDTVGDKPPPPPTSSINLPLHWKSAVDDNGRVYYYHMISK